MGLQRVGHNLATEQQQQHFQVFYNRGVLDCVVGNLFFVFSHSSQHIEMLNDGWMDINEWINEQKDILHLKCLLLTNIHTKLWGWGTRNIAVVKQSSLANHVLSLTENFGDRLSVHPELWHHPCLSKGSLTLWPPSSSTSHLTNCKSQGLGIDYGPMYDCFELKGIWYTELVPAESSEVLKEASSLSS